MLGLLYGLTTRAAAEGKTVPLFHRVRETPSYTLLVCKYKHTPCVCEHLHTNHPPRLHTGSADRVFFAHTKTASGLDTTHRADGRPRRGIPFASHASRAEAVHTHVRRPVRSVQFLKMGYGLPSRQSGW
ncbi:hypothetical protein EVAR_48996_1 [Eumeta japonica]|uniref:Uncharacterized protein n=1 Tax=Eumeta variegata TaxID=151549 RepID=A0A4C1Z2T5_EUMVA|nr:hypothetical protein EVAR_48996_1 [Eumeta japonica]